MKKIHLTALASLLLFASFIFSGCAKEEDAPEEKTPSNPITPPPAKFSWVINGGAEVTADETYYVAAYSNIYAAKGTRTVDIILDDLSKGTYQISAPAITIDYFDGTNTHSGKSGTVVISENTGSLLSGSFTCALSGGGSNSSITGQFSSVPKK